MKRKLFNKCIKRVVSLVVMVIFAMSLFTNALAYAKAEELPHVDHWLNGAAVDSAGSFLSDTWAIDDSGVDSLKKYVLVNQEYKEEMRIEKYPDDIKTGDTSPCPTYNKSFKLSLPEGVTGEVTLAFESDSAIYYISFDAENSYIVSNDFLPGVYKVTEVDVLVDTENEYSLKEAYSFNTSEIVADEDIDTLEVVNKQSLATDKTDSAGNVVADEETNSNSVNYKSFDSNNDLLSDTVGLVIAVALLFIIYAAIKYKRKKAEELKK